MVYPETLRFWLKNKHGDLQSAAKKYGVDPTTLSRYFTKGKLAMKPSFDFLLKLKNDGCDLNWLLTTVEPLAVMEPTTEYSVTRLVVPDELNLLRAENQKLKEILNHIKGAAGEALDAIEVKE